MEGPGKHIIRKQVVDVVYYGNTDGFLLQREINEWCNKELALKLEEQLDRLGSGNKILRIDKLEIDIELGNYANWKELATRQIETRIKDISIGTLLQNDAEFISGENHFIGEFIYFLRYGNLPWWSALRTEQEWTTMLNEFLSMDLTRENKVKIIELLKQANVLLRVVRLPAEQFVKLIARLEQEHIKYLNQLTAEIDRSLDPAQQDAIHQILRMAVLKSIVTEKEGNIMQYIVDVFVEALDSNSLFFLQQNRDTIFLPELKEALVETRSREIKKVEKKGDEQTDKKELIDELKEGIFINNAGLVIVAAFLPVFFKKLMIATDNELTDQHKAACLIQFLASGKEQVVEFELGLARILSGLELDEPVNTMLKISEEEINEADELLRSILEYWNILKNTSVEGLRESFLMRAGKLSFDGKEWLLQVEQKGYDVLMQNLPWNISMIKLPWMKYLLRTEWVS